MLGKKKKNQEGQSQEDVAENDAFSERDADFSALDRDETEVPGVQEAPENTPDFESDDSEINKLKEELAQAKTEIAGLNDKYLRSLAEFENYKKRTLKERSDLLKYQGESIFLDLLEVIDNLELALTHADADPASIKDGLDMIFRKFISVLSKWEVRSDSALGKVFDPSRNNAISRIALDDTQPGTVVNELKKTYMYKDKLLRAGDVVVAVEKPAPAGEQALEGDPEQEEGA